LWSETEIFDFKSETRLRPLISGPRPRPRPRR